MDRGVGMNQRLRSLFQKSLGNHPGPDAARAAREAPMLIVAAQRLFERASRIGLQETPDAKIDREALEAACMALSLPFAVSKDSTPSIKATMADRSTSRSRWPTPLSMRAPRL